VTVSITNMRRRLVTLLVPDGDGTHAVRIASMQTVRGLDDAVLDLPAVRSALRAGELEAQRDASRATPARAEIEPGVEVEVAPSRSRKAKQNA